MSDDHGVTGAPAGVDPAVPPEFPNAMRASEVIAIVERAFDAAAAAPEAEDTWMRFSPSVIDARAVVADYLRSEIEGLQELVTWLVPDQSPATRPASTG